jgi:hypothetical protein
MALKRSTPGEGGATPRRETFAYHNTAPGLKNAWNGWLACDVYWCKAHEHKPPQQYGTKPCLHWLTNGAVGCPWCRPGAVVKDIGYVHLYRETDLKAMLVLVQDSVADLLAGLSFGSHVLVGRLEASASTFVKRSDSNVPWRTDSEHRKRPIDIALSLLALWAVPALDSWYMGRQQPGPAEVQPVPGAQVDGWNRFVQLGSVGSMEGTVAATGTPNEEFVRQVKQGAQPSKNGKGKHHPPAG